MEVLNCGFHQMMEKIIVTNVITRFLKMKCNGTINDFAKGWTQKGNSWHCSIYCFCSECEFREVTEGAKIEVWQSVKKVGNITESGIFNIQEPMDILLEED